MHRRILVLALALGPLLLGVLPAAPTLAQEAEPSFTVDRVLVNKTGGISAMGTVDCSAAVAEHWGGVENVPPGTMVLVNVSWTAWQPQGRRMNQATLQDSQASQCWSNTSDYLEPGRCVEASPGIWSPCRWDSSNWGSSGFVYGNGKFIKGRVHIQAVLEGGWYATDPDTGEPISLDFYEVRDYDVVATLAK